MNLIPLAALTILALTLATAVTTITLVTKHRTRHTPKKTGRHL